MRDANLDRAVNIDSQGSEWKGDLDDLISTLTKTNYERKEAA